MGSPGYPAAEAADPSAFALKIRRQLTDEKRTLRVYGSEVVIARLTGDGSQIRLHLLNYGGREIEGLRIRVRGAYANGDAQIAGAGRVPLADYAVADGFTEFSVPRLATYAVVDLKSDGEAVKYALGCERPGHPRASPVPPPGTRGWRARWPSSPPRSRRPCSTRPSAVHRSRRLSASRRRPRSRPSPCRTESSRRL